MNLWTYPGVMELVRKKIDDGKSLMKDLIVGKVRRQKTLSFGSIKKRNIRLSNIITCYWQV
jgi:hypothetical protein